MRTKFTYLLFFVLSVVLTSRSQAQKSWFKMDTLAVLSSNGKKLLNPWSGGLNSGQFTKMDLNGDGTEDLIVFDRTSGILSTFLAVTDPANAQKKVWKHAPSYEYLFPKMDNWMVLADLNKDGYKDLFTYTPLGIMVYKQVRDGKNWSFKLEKPALYTEGLSGNVNLQVSGQDIPGISDIDNDGDIDVITFDYEGMAIELHQNMSMERYGVPDSLVYKRNGQCWGNFHKGDNEDFVMGEDCGVVGNSPRRVMHTGNSIMLHDLDGDGKKDLIVGHVSNDHISFLKNTGENLVANFTSYTHNYPSVDPISFYIFPAVYYEDVDFDGVKDLIAAPNVPNNDGNLMNLQSSNWLYHNAGTSDKADFKLVQKNFLQDQMLDVGENAAPSFFDVDGDGDLDMVIGAGGTRDGNNFRGRLWLLRNVGDKQNPAFELASDNYLNVPATLDMYNLKPQWADFNGDGVPDLGFAGTTLKGLAYYYIPNKAGKDQAVQLNAADMVSIAMPAQSQIADYPYFYDADGDGDLDLLVGKPQGNINYFKNTGSSKQFTLTLETESFAGLVGNFDGRNVQVSVADVDVDGRPDLLTVDFSGKLRIFYSGEWGKWTQRESLLIDHNGKGDSPLLGFYLYATAADYNGDGKPDVAVGGNGGGLHLLQNVLPLTITPVEPPLEQSVKVYPNPAREYIKVLSSQNAKLSVFSVTGLAVQQDIVVNANREKEIPTLNWAPGLYLLEFNTGSARVVKKIVIQ
ncbi:T9SS type A sorting domain-containing protein [Dyadobacter diqingensis]|uniref:T9SS type A sorting domain-containing protein n=1 Tax=Dyadobacter diqingensis TaxID=2938121 RepID=UPI0020C1A389|nr:T9SS type A sorting domain-containing protein [Dyadobacter diqingensis]